MEAASPAGSAADFRLLLLRLRHYARRSRWITQRPDPDPVETVHELRVLAKRARALLKLCRGSAPPERIQALDRALRSGMHRLGSSRDKAVETALLRRYAKARREPPPQATESRTPLDRATALVEALENAAFETAGHSWLSQPADPIRDRLDRSYRKARRRWKTEVRNPTPEHLHKWRIAHKTLFYQLEAVSLHKAVTGKKQFRRLKAVGALLGEAHDLSLFLEHQGERLSCKEARKVKKTYAKKRARALRIAHKLLRFKHLQLKDKDLEKHGSDFRSGSGERTPPFREIRPRTGRS